ncbi:MAG: LytR/AlgR family response regulator transcription factor, partial [Blastocatellia bacterium]
MTTTAVIIEDEPYARQTLKDFLAETDWVELVGEADNGPEAVRLLRELRPQLVFLDVQMPGLSGLQVLDQISYEPAVIFTTAHDEYAVRAFEFGAIDYLLKPFGRARFRKTLD